MKKMYDATEAPIKVFGLPLLYETGEWRELPEQLMHDVPTIHQFGRLVTGSRIAFSTNASEFTIRCRVKMQFENEATSWLFGTGFNVYAGERTSARYLGYLSITQYGFEWLNIEKTFKKGSNDVEDITIYLAPQVFVERCEIIVDSDAVVEEPTPYKYAKPVVFFMAHQLQPAEPQAEQEIHT